MNVVLRVNNELEGYDLIDMDSPQSHDGDNACELLGTVYDEPNAQLIRGLLNRWAIEQEKVKKAL